MNRTIEELYYDQVIGRNCSDQQDLKLEDLYEQVYAEQALDENGRQQLGGIYEEMLVKELYHSQALEESVEAAVEGPVEAPVEAPVQDESITFTEFYKNTINK